MAKHITLAISLYCIELSSVLSITFPKSQNIQQNDQRMNGSSLRITPRKTAAAAAAVVAAAARRRHTAAAASAAGAAVAAAAASRTATAAEVPAARTVTARGGLKKSDILNVLDVSGRFQCFFAVLRCL